jgi:dethiobiotin synthetase
MLLVEGSGGLLVPLGNGFSVADFIAKLDCKALVMARNRLGTINHTLLTVNALQSIGRKPLAIALMGASRPDISAKKNADALAQLLSRVHVVEIPFLGRRPARPEAIRRSLQKTRKCLKIVMALVGFF